jgi:hypothetical protein
MKGLIDVPYPSATYEAKTPSKKGVLDTLQDRIRQNINETRDASYQLNTIADKLFGPRPVTATTNNAEEPYGSISEISELLREQTEAISYLYEQVKRLQEL